MSEKVEKSQEAAQSQLSAEEAKEVAK